MSATILSRLAGTLQSLFSVGPQSTTLVLGGETRAVNLGAAPGTPAYNPNWYGLTDIYWDPGNVSGAASDTAPGSGATSALPVLTFKEIVRRWGSRFPVLMAAQLTTLHQLSSQPAGSATTDPMGTWGPSCPFGAFAWIGVLKAVGSTFAAGTITQITRSTSGNDFKVGSMPGGAAAGMVLQDQTIGSGGSYTTIDSITGGVATCTNPLAATGYATVTNAPVIPADGASWTAGDTCQLYSVPTCFCDAFLPQAGTLASTGATSPTGLTWMQWIGFADPSATPGTSNTIIHPIGELHMLGVQAQTYPTLNYLDMSTVPDASPVVAGCWFQYGAQFQGTCNILSGAFATTGGECLFQFADIKLLLDCILHRAPLFFPGIVYAENVHLEGVCIVEQGANFVMRTGGTGAVCWQTAATPATMRVTANAGCLNRTGSNWATVMAIGTLQLTNAALTTGTTYQTGTPPVWASGVSLTPAGIDSAPGTAIFDPTTGARFSLA